MQRICRLSAISAVAMVFAACSVQESTRGEGLIAPPSAPPVSIETVPTVVTVPPDDEPSSAEPSAAAAAADPSDSRAGTSLDPSTAPTDHGGPGGARQVLADADPPPGFGEGLLGVSGPSGTRLWPVLVADTPPARQRGLMGVHDFAALGGYAAMVFIFESDTSGAFWMRDTPLELRITFVSANGAVVSATDMVPCLAPKPPDECEFYYPKGPYRIAIEHPLGPVFDIGLATAEFVEVTVE